MPTEPTQAARVALIVDYTSQWVNDILPNSPDFDLRALNLAWYSAVRGLGLDVDVLPASADFSDYALVLVPSLANATDEFAQALQRSGAQVLFGPRSGAKTAELCIPDGLPPGALRGLLPGLRVVGVEGLRPGVALSLRAEEDGPALASGTTVTRWRDVLDAPAPLQIEARYADGTPALVRHHRTRYLSGWLNEAALAQLMSHLAHEAGLPTLTLPSGLRLRRRGQLQFAIHHGSDTVPVPAPADAHFVLGGPTLEPAGVAAWWVNVPAAETAASGVTMPLPAEATPR